MTADRIVETAAGVWEVYCCILLFRFFAERKKEYKRWLALIKVCTLTALYLLAGSVWRDHDYLRAAAVCLLVSFFMYAIFRIRYAMALVLAMLYHGLYIVSAYIATVISVGIPLPVLGRVPEISFLPAGVMFTLVRELLLTSGILLLGKMAGGRPFAVLPDREWRILFFSSFSTVVSFLILTGTDRHYDRDRSGPYPYLAAGILFIDFVVYRMAIEATEREQKRREDETFREKVKNELEMYRSISGNLDRQKKRAHEYKNQIAAISALTTERKYEALQSYLGKIQDTLRSHMDTIDTGHMIVNAVLNTKYREAAEKGILFILKVNDLTGLEMEDEDIVIILSNLLNNAFEACGRAEGERVVKFKFVLEEGRVVISAKNSMKAEPVRESGILLTTKEEDRAEHGFGIENVIETVEKYGGNYVIDYGGDSFLFSVLIPFPNLS